MSTLERRERAHQLTGGKRSRTQRGEGSSQSRMRGDRLRRECGRTRIESQGLHPIGHNSHHPTGQNRRGEQSGVSEWPSLPPASVSSPLPSVFSAVACQGAGGRTYCCSFFTTHTLILATVSCPSLMGTSLMPRLRSGSSRWIFLLSTLIPCSASASAMSRLVTEP